MNGNPGSLNLSAFIIVLGILFGQTACKERSREEVEQIIAKSETLRHIDQICREFPTPERFELEKKGIYGNSETSSITYQYIAHMPFEEVKTFYQNPILREDYNFRAENYAEPLRNEIWFKRDDVSINVDNQPPSWIVNIGCSKRN